MDSSNNNHDHYHYHGNNHDDQVDDYELLPFLTDVVNTNNCNVDAIFNSSDDQSLQNSPAFAHHNLPHAVIPSTFHHQALTNSEVANVNDETAVEVIKLRKVGTSSAKKRKREDVDNSTLPASGTKKALYFSIISLQIGSWKQRQAKHGEELMARCYFNPKPRFAWEVLLDNGLKKKLEFLFSDIDAINSFITPEKGFLNIRLKNRPRFHHEINQRPKKHTIWKKCTDFTYHQEATRTRVHKLEISSRDLQKHYNGIIEYDNELLELSKKEFPVDESPLFDDVHREPYINNSMNPFYTLSEFPSNFPISPQPPLTAQCYGIDAINAIPIQHTESGENYTVDEYPSQLYDNSNNHHLGSATPPPVPALNYTVNAHGRPQDWCPRAYTRLGTLPMAPLSDGNVPAPAHAMFNYFDSNTSVDVMQLPLRYLQQHGSSYSNDQLQGQASCNHDVGHLA